MGHYKNLIKEPEFIMKNGRPTGIILGLKEYQELLERIEDVEDLAELKRIRGNKPQFRRIDDFLKEAH